LTCEVVGLWVLNIQLAGGLRIFSKKIDSVMGIWIGGCRVKVSIDILKGRAEPQKRMAVWKAEMLSS
jgi:hypothetical protein